MDGARTRATVEFRVEGGRVILPLRLMGGCCRALRRIPRRHSQGK